MSPLLRPACLDDPSELVELVSEAIVELISGGVLLDAAVGKGEFGFFDLLAANEHGEGVFFFINFSGCETEYLRLLKCMRWHQENWDTLHKVHAGRVALGPTPPVFVVAPSYSYSMQKVLLNIYDGRMILMKYVCFQDGNGKKSLFIETVGDSSEDAGKADCRAVSGTLSTLAAADWSKTDPAEKMTYLRRFRREMGFDISNVSDEELLDLLG